MPNCLFYLRNIGNVSGYIVIPLFSFVNFNFLGVIVDKYNAAGFFAAILFVISFFLTVALYFDLSRLTEDEQHQTNEQSRVDDSQQACLQVEADAEGRRSELTKDSLAASSSMTSTVSTASTQDVGEEKEEKRKSGCLQGCFSCPKIVECTRSTYEAFKQNVVR